MNPDKSTIFYFSWFLEKRLIITTKVYNLFSDIPVEEYVFSKDKTFREKPALDTLINEEALLLAKFLRNEGKNVFLD